ncbi:MAG: GYD domain-containing protein [Acidimicrobiia bacterium]|nr:GYD domain-containing protein [Acidimicrobiia bacterium]MBP8181485.1 GYD domain-containing protein [Acidimicrobiia bacterium]
MPTYAMLSTVGPDGWNTIRKNPERITQVKAEVERMGLRVVAQYALLGQYDFLNIIEAEDDLHMARAATMLAARGTMRTTTINAMPIEDFVEVLKSEPK